MDEILEPLPTLILQRERLERIRDFKTPPCFTLNRVSAATLAGAYVELADAMDSLVSAPLRYNDNRIEIDCADHLDAMRRVRAAREALAKAKGTA